MMQKRLKQAAGMLLILLLSGFFAVVLSLITHAVLTAYFYLHTRNYYSELSESEKKAYSHIDPADVEDLLQVTWSEKYGGWEYQPWVGFREKPRKSKFLNVSPYGIRANSEEVREIESLDDSVWFFGGSTTFGYGVADNETIPAVLESALDQRVSNLGRGYFYSAQENFLFKQLLEAGYRPATAVFLDGLNERCSIDIYQSEMANFFEQSQYHYRWSISEVFRPILFVSDQVLPSTEDAPTTSLHHLECESYGRVQSLGEVVKTNLRDRASLCELYNVHCLTFVQPIAGLHGVHEDFNRLPESSRKLLREKYVHLKPIWSEAGATFLDGALEGLEEHAYVDDVHYSAAASRKMANAMSKPILNSH